MKQLLVIPQLNDMQNTIALAEEYSLGYEYNDFFDPNVLDDSRRVSELAEQYRAYEKQFRPGAVTLHGAFFDVIPFSMDKRIAEISAMRIEQSIAAAELMGARGVVFHTNYDPFLCIPSYIEYWINRNADFWGGVLSAHGNIQIWLENMFDTAPDIMLELSGRLCRHENFGVCLDYAHASLSKVPAPVWAEKLGKYVRHVHINDNDLAADLHLAWGDGRIIRSEFYECFNKFLDEPTVLVETSSVESQRRSLETLDREGFLK